MHLDNKDPHGDRLPYSTLTYWNGRPDNKYSVEHINQPRKLAEDQLVTRHGDTQDAKGANKPDGSRDAKASNTG